MDEKYDHQKIEAKWQKVWGKNKLYETPDKADDKPNFYTLVEFPYPSGNLHIGHWYAFAVPDIYARFKRMQGHNVMFPIGFDAFGLPAENAAIKHNTNPRKWTYENIAFMEKQLQSMGNTFDWSRRIVTSDPEYYKWTQWLFLQFYKKGLAYKKKGSVNWCPSCKTVLANEQVIGGKCERCGTEVIQKDLEQWFFKITDYAEKLLEGLDKLNWPEEIKTAQRNWIGKSEGTLVKFQITNSKSEIQNSKPEYVEVFTTRVDTLFGVTYLVVAPEYEKMEEWEEEKIIKNWNEVENYINKSKNRTEIERTSEGKEKTGVRIEGVTAINPANGDEVPVFVADYVLGNYGTGAVMAVPAHDERDFAFAQKYKLPVKEVISGGDISKEAFIGEGMLVNSNGFNGVGSEEAREKITEKFGEKVIKYKLRDWLLSRQRYWGCPIPIVYDPQGEPHPVPEDKLPWLLPDDVTDYAPKGESPIGTSKEFKERTEREFGKGWAPECDTMDTFVDSSWYFNRYADPKNKDKFADKNKLGAWMPVNRYSGGAEHTNMHLLYSRFFHKALFDMGMVGEDEPFVERMNRGLILGPDGQKMSKSRGNVIDPDRQVEQVGADTVKMYLAFIGPYNEVGQYPWDLGGIAGVRRFLERVWKMSLKLKVKSLEEEKISDSKLETSLHKTIKKVTEDVEAYKFNTAISAMMVLLNQIEKNEEGASKKYFETFLKLLAPFAPHITEEIWDHLGNKQSIHLETWPKHDESKIKEENAVIVVQVNGKVRAQFVAAAGISENEAKNKAFSLIEVNKWLVGKEIKKIIFVPDKIINFVV